MKLLKENKFCKLRLMIDSYSNNNLVIYTGKIDIT